MLKFDLNGQWNMKRTVEEEWLSVKVPGTVFNDLLNHGKIEDPFYRCNEEHAKEIASYDYEYVRSFVAPKQLINQDKVFLCCDGIDTLSKITINGHVIGETNNMHTRYEFDIKSYLVEGNNTIHVTIYSPTKYIEKKNKEQYLWGATDAMAGFPYIRKAHSSFGWDWGPQIPDSGIWRNIYINAFSTARLSDVYVTQKHGKGSVDLDIKVEIDDFKNSKLIVEAVVTSPANEKFITERAVKASTEHLNIEILRPELWWPNNFGEHPLYKLEVNLRKEEQKIDSNELTIGLRTLTVRKEKDEYGESFEFNINGKSIFSMGADYIPEDNLLSRCSPERTEKLIRDCVRANYNSIRVWGGGIYPEDYFFELCDKYGLIVWQDLMYACAVYDMTEEFTDNIKKETIDNVKRIRHHASLGLWCGNNEMEMGWVYWDFPKTSKLRTDYIKQFEIILPELVKKYDPNTFYWPASPSSGGGFEEPNSENIGDVHYWDVWHGLKPFTEYRKFYFRFVSEFGFQSFPELKTVESFTLPEDRNIFSEVMENHQKNGAANGKILYYLSENLKYPKDFDSLLYASQILQAEAIKYGVEHWRRNRGRCMGAIYWQINDCWPVASWSSLDYFGRWKALHYYARRFFNPILLSACENGTQVELNISNETFDTFNGKIVWKLRDNKFGILAKGLLDVEVPALSALNLIKLELDEFVDTKHKRKETYLEYSLLRDEEVISSDTVLFVPTKHFNFLDPEITAEVKETEECFEITLISKAYASGVELGLLSTDCTLSDNYFHLSAGKPRTIIIDKKDMSSILSLEEIKGSLKIRSIFDMA